ncbi:MAG: site-specific integrase [Pseudomonadota bacterium]|nr:site-specific integrase [Pseudomonadota bacterium]
MSYLFRRNGIFYFRFAIPAQLRKVYGGKTEIRKSLGTFDKTTAQTLALYIAVHLKAHMTVKRKANLQDETRPELTRVLAEDTCPLIEIRLGEDDPVIIINHDTYIEELYAAKEILSHLQPRIDSHASVATPPSPTSSPTSTGITLSELTEKYTEEQLAAGNWSEKTTHENGAIYRLFITVTGDIPVDTISHVHARDFKSALLKLPANMNKSPLYRNKSVQQILSMNVEKTLAIATVNKHLTHCGSLFGWAVSHGYTTLNPFIRMGVKTKRKANQDKLPFEQGDLDKLFTPRVKYRHPYYYWMPLLGYYTGCRIEELCQLHTHDIKQQNGTWVFDINGADEKKLKTLASERLIPIHSHLIDLGFLEFANKPKREMVFRELKKRRDGYSQDVSKWFGRYRHSVGVAHKKKTFHSFRHTVSLILKNAKVEQKMIIAILGHADRDISTGVYGGDYDPRVLSEAIETITRLEDIIPYSQI